MTLESFFGWATAALFFISYLPQLRRTYLLKSVDDISPALWGLCFTAYITLFCHAYLVDSLPLLVNAILGLSCTGYMLIMIALYRDEKKDEIRDVVQEVISAAKKKFKEKE